jgi:biotin transport system permease protein
MHPLSKIFLTLLLSSLALHASLPFSLLLTITLTITLLLIRVPLREYGKEGRYFFIIIMIISISTYLYLKDVIQTVRIAFSFFSMIELSILLMDTTAFDDLSMALGSVLSIISKKRGYRIASTIELTLAMIPLFFDITQSVSFARKARGEKLYRHPIESLTGYVSSVLSLIFVRIEHLELALKARQFDPDRKRETLHFSKRDLLFVFTVTLASILLYFTI